MAARARGLGARLRQHRRRAAGSRGPRGSRAGLFSWIAWRLGEAAAEESLEWTADVVMTPFINAVRELTLAESIPAWSVAWRSHGSTFWIEGHEETVLLRSRPLGACHRMLSSPPTSGGADIREPRPSPDLRLLGRARLLPPDAGASRDHRRIDRLPDLRLPLPHAPRCLPDGSGIRSGWRSTTSTTATARWCTSITRTPPIGPPISLSKSADPRREKLGVTT